jgi:hypothetical protein
MSAPAKCQPTLTDAEWKLVIELLQRERRELPAEIHHTDATDVRERLHYRVAAIDNLLARLREPA